MQSIAVYLNVYNCLVIISEYRSALHVMTLVGGAAASETLIGGYIWTIGGCSTPQKQPRENAVCKVWHQFQTPSIFRPFDLVGNVFASRDSWCNILSTGIQSCVEHQTWKYHFFQKLSWKMRCARSNINSDRGHQYNRIMAHISRSAKICSV